ncbi:DUF3987 domain-containing protein [Providencia stuartii]
MTQRQRTNGVYMNRFPLNAFPRNLKEVILDLREETQAPVPLIASSVLSALSLSLQDKLDVQVTSSLRSPVSLFFLVIANSGERKTSVDRRVLAPIYEHDRISVIPPFLTEVISRIRSFVVDVALGYSHSTPCSAVRDYKTIATV